MHKNLFQLDQSSGWLLLILAVALGLTWWLYSKKKNPWNKAQNWILAILRFVALFLLLVLLLEPLIKQVASEVEKPIVAIAIDNSESVVAHEADPVSLKQQLGQLATGLQDAGLEVRTYSFDEYDSLTFTHDITDLSRLLGNVDEDMEGRNWAASIVLTDGIFNQGSSPLYRPYKAPQFLVGLGDTIPPKDITISRVKHNRITYKGNKTPIRVEILQKGYDGELVTLALTEGDRTIDQQRVLLDQPLQEAEFVIQSEEEGLRQLSVSIPVQKEEFVSENNQYRIFMEVIGGRQKVLMVANAPHPDIKAIRSTLASTGNYEVDVFIPTLEDDAPTKIYDVVVRHGAFTGGVRYQPKENPGIWYILNKSSSLSNMNRQLNFASIRKRGPQPDKVTAAFNISFSKFKISTDQGLFEDFPPLEAPFGDYEWGAGSEVLLYQRVGNIATNKPLFTFFDDGSSKCALLIGQGIWKWKLQEAAINGNSNQFDELVSKTIQFLSVKNDKKQFQLQSRGNSFSSIERPLFDAEVYNGIYERIYGNTVQLRIAGENANVHDFEFVDSEFKSSFKIPPLASGVYSYSASTKIGEETFRDGGQFLVEAINREYLDLAADHNLLKNIARKTNGGYIHYSSIDQVTDKIVDRDFKSIIRSSETFFPLKSNQWLLFVILLLFSSEWLLRKYWGGY